MQAMTTPPTIALYLVWDQPASLMNMSTTIGSVNKYNSESKQRNIRMNEERVENPFTML